MLTDWILRLRSLVKRDAVERELDEELRFFRGHRLFLAFAIELHVIEPPVVAGLLDQLGMGANFFDVAFFHNYDLIGG